MFICIFNEKTSTQLPNACNKWTKYSLSPSEMHYHFQTLFLSSFFTVSMKPCNTISWSKQLTSLNGPLQAVKFQKFPCWKCAHWRLSTLNVSLMLSCSPLNSCDGNASYMWPRLWQTGDFIYWWGQQSGAKRQSEHSVLILLALQNSLVSTREWNWYSIGLIH